MKLYKNPFFYLSLILSILVIFQVFKFVSAAWTEPLVGFPNGNPAAPLDTSTSTQSKSGLTISQSNLLLGPLVPLYGTNGTAAQLSYLPRDSFGSSFLYFDGSGLFIKKFASKTDLFSVLSNGSISFNSLSVNGRIFTPTVSFSNGAEDTAANYTASICEGNLSGNCEPPMSNLAGCGLPPDLNAPRRPTYSCGPEESKDCLDVLLLRERASSPEFQDVEWQEVSCRVGPATLSFVEQ